MGRIHDENVDDVPDRMAKGDVGVTEKAYAENRTQQSPINDNVAIACTHKKTNAQLTIPEFYTEKGRCSHSFKNDTVFFHVGKGGGGTIRSILEDDHSLYLSVSHPAVNPKLVEALQKGPATTLVINVYRPPPGEREGTLRAPCRSIGIASLGNTIRKGGGRCYDATTCASERCGKLEKTQQQFL